MCAVSMVTDYYRQTYLRPEDWTPYVYQDYWSLKKKAEQYDVDNNQPDCEKPEITEWERSIMALVEKTFGLKPPEQT